MICGQHIELQLSEDEKQLYSRQLNQKTLTEQDLLNIIKMKTLIVGINSNCSEIIKNLTKNGSKSIYLCDDTFIEEKDIRNIYQFTIDDLCKKKEEVMKNKIPEVNLINLKEICYENLKQIGINSLVLTKVFDWKEIERLNYIANQLQIPFIFSCQLGLSFFIFSDFGKERSKNCGSNSQYLPLNSYFSPKISQSQMKSSTVYDFDKEIENFILLYSIIEFFRLNSHLPKLYNKEQSEQFYNIYSKLSQNFDIEQIYDEETIQNFAQTQEIEIPILSEILGALTSTEILKSVILRFSPLNQTLFWENFNLLNQIELPVNKDFVMKQKEISFNGLYDYQMLFGKDIMNQISNLKILVVGCGAVGSEQVKNLYQMGACTGEKGHIYLVDNDRVEIQNIPKQDFKYQLLLIYSFLSFRQVLSTQQDIKQYKAQTCMKWIQRKDSSVNVTAYNILLCKENEHIFNYDFYENLDLIIIAVDSVVARLYLAEKAIKHNIFLVESATEGFGAQSQCQIPKFSNKIQIAQEQQINTQSCTIKSTLKTVGDALIYSKSFFETVLSCLRDQSNDFLKDEDLLKFLDLYQNKSKKPYRCDELLKVHIEKMFNNIFFDDIIQNYHNYNPIKFDKNNSDHIQFVDSLYQILERSYLSEQAELFKKQNVDQNLNLVDEDFKVKNLQKHQIELNSILPKFDKDDLHHGNLVYQIANLRAKVFDINFQLEKYDAIGLIGGIIPAIIQSTSVASGFALLELFTWLVNKEKILQLYQNVLKQNQEAFNKIVVNSSNNLLQEDEKKNPQIFLFKEQIDEVENLFYQFGFKQYYGQIHKPCDLGKCLIQFELTQQLQNFTIQCQQSDILEHLIDQINQILLQNKISSLYIIEVENNQIYRQDADNSILVTNLTKQKQSENLKKTIIEAINSVLPHRSTDTIFNLVVFNFELNSRQRKIKGKQIAQIKLKIQNLKQL